MMLGLARTFDGLADRLEGQFKAIPAGDDWTMRKASRRRSRKLTKQPPNPTDTFVGNKLKALRKERGLTQTQVGVALGLTFQQIQKYERGTNRISASKLHQLAEVLKVSPEHFFEGLEIRDNLIGFPTRDYEKELSGNSEALGLMNAFNRSAKRPLRRSIISMVAELAGPEQDAGTAD